MFNGDETPHNSSTDPQLVPKILEILGMGFYTLVVFGLQIQLL
jgi:hypothetical protein